VEKEELEEEL
jgi:hypothetical protein